MDTLDMDTAEIINSITEIAADFGLRLFYAVLIIFVGRWVVKLLLKIIKSALEKTAVEETVRIFVANLLNTLLMVIILLQPSINWVLRLPQLLRCSVQLAWQ